MTKEEVKPVPFNKDYSVKDDPAFLKFTKRSMDNVTERKYYFNLKNYTNFHQMSLDALLKEADDEEEAGVRLNKRKVYDRILDFRNHLLSLGRARNTVNTNITSVKTFYRESKIELPNLPKVHSKKFNKKEKLMFSELPDKNTMRTVIQGSKTPKHIALFGFCYVNGTARAELASLTYGQVMESLSEWIRIPATPEDIVNELDGRCAKLEIIPIIRMVQSKTQEDYYTLVTPEVLQFMIDYLKQNLSLKPEDPFFQLSVDGISSAFQNTNGKYDFGKSSDGNGFFSNYHIRKWNATVIGDKDFADYIQGRKENVINETYYLKDLNRLRNKYKDHIHKLGIFDNYELAFNSEAYDKLKAEMDAKEIQHTKELEELQKKHNEEMAKQKAENEEKTAIAIEEALETERTLTQQKLDEQSKEIREIKQSLQKDPYNEDIEMDLLDYKIQNNIHDQFFEAKLRDFALKQLANGNYSKEKIPQWAQQVQTLIQLQPEQREIFEESIKEQSNETKEKIANKTANLKLFYEIKKELDISEEMIDKIDYYISANTSSDRTMTQEEITVIIIKVLSNDIDDDIDI